MVKKKDRGKLIEEETKTLNLGDNCIFGDIGDCVPTLEKRGETKPNQNGDSVKRKSYFENPRINDEKRKEEKRRGLEFSHLNFKLLQVLCPDLKFYNDVNTVAICMVRHVKRDLELGTVMHRLSVHWHTLRPLQFLVVSQRFEYDHFDIMRSLSSSEGYVYLITFIYRFSRWTKTILVQNIMAETIAPTFGIHLIVRFRISKIITIDQGRQLEYHLFS
ncbi:hypothetical protein NPIL_646471 [Nephila pilipes]|uniref:Integrase catalytic domain-containing protein n=1 Tax=Nephila pilipes TaxID=299642 RepID=A0A8X6QUT1_NEPPI|nr:hypothetical protein NPIL_646471 [Nephila pilipes]